MWSILIVAHISMWSILIVFQRSSSIPTIFQQSSVAIILHLSKSWQCIARNCFLVLIIFYVCIVCPFNMIHKVQNKNVLKILTLHKHPLQAQVSLSFENQRRPNNQIKSISCFCVPNIFKPNEWAVNHWQVNSSPADIYSPKNLNVLLNTAIVQADPWYYARSTK